MSSHDGDFDVRYPPTCPHIIDRAPMRMRWLDLTMLHWRFPADEVQALLPEGLMVETFDGSAWVGLVPFRMEVDLPFLPRFERILHFPETNVRTYVHGPSGEPGVYFWSLEASSLPAVIAARGSYQVPYFWADMSVETSTSTGRPIAGETATTGDRLRYVSTRRWPKPSGASSVVEVEVGDPRPASDIGELDNFLTARWALYGSFWKYRSYATMYHEPWPLHSATLLHCDDELVAATGLTQPTDPPIMHYSPGVNVRSGWPGKA